VAQAYGLLAEAETGRNRPAAAHLAVAEQYYRQDELMLAIDQLKLARNDTTADFYTLSRVDARLAELERRLPTVPKQ
jgi:predicted Zn-dependent protease